MNVKPMLTLAAACCVWLPSVVMAQPETKKEQKTEAAKPAETTAGDVTVVYEVFSLETAKAGTLRRENSADANLYASLIAGVEKGDVIQETLAVIRGGTGTKFSLESIAQIKYPLEWDTAEIPGTPPAKRLDHLFAVPISLTAQTRSLGLMLEVEAKISGHAPFINLELIPNHVALAGRSVWGENNWAVELPEFMNQRLDSEVRVRDGQPFLLGTLSPQQLKQPGQERIWFAFVSSTVRHYPASSAKEAEGDPFEQDPSAEPAPLPPSTSFVYETFSLPFKEAAELRRKTAAEKDFYNELVARAAKGQAKQESLVVIRGNHTSRFISQGGTEHLSPTDSDHIDFGDSKLAEKLPLSERFPYLPTAFETRNCGTYVQLEATVNNDNDWVILQTNISHTTLGESTIWGKGAAETKLPTYHDQRIQTSVFTPLGEPCFIGTMNPPDKLQGDAKPDKRVWFAFITPDLAK